MKKSTFLLILILITAIAQGQTPQNLQHKIKEMQATFSRFTMQTEHFSKLNLTAKPGIKKDLRLKNALAAQKLDSIIYQETDMLSGEWQNLWKDEYLYDSEMKNTAWIEKDWDSTTETWEQSSKVELELNDAGQVEVMNNYYVDETSGELVLETRSEAFYSPAGRLDSIVHYTPDTGDTWVKEGWQVYHYNETGQLVQMDMTSTEVVEGEETMQSMKFVYTYDNEGNMATSSWYYADPEMNFLFSKTEYFYDESNKLIAEEDSSINFLTFQFERSSRYDIEYNAEGDVSVETYSSWDSVEEQWVAEEKDEYTYNSTSFSEVIFPSYLQFWGTNEDSFTFNFAITEIVTSSIVEDQWVPTDRSVFYYSEGTSTNVRELVEAKVSVYPNPATENITLTWNNYRQLWFEVYNISGAKVIEKQVSSGMNVSLSPLRNGIYLFKLKKENQTVYSGKLIKK